MRWGRKRVIYNLSRITRINYATSCGRWLGIVLLHICCRWRIGIMGILWFGGMELLYILILGISWAMCLDRAWSYRERLRLKWQASTSIFLGAYSLGCSISSESWYFWDIRRAGSTNIGSWSWPNSCTQVMGQQCPVSSKAILQSQALRTDWTPLRCILMEICRCIARIW
jgi:hypothetical protein